MEPIWLLILAKWPAISIVWLQLYLPKTPPLKTGWPVPLKQWLWQVAIFFVASCLVSVSILLSWSYQTGPFDCLIATMAIPSPISMPTSLTPGSYLTLVTHSTSLPSNIIILFQPTSSLSSLRPRSVPMPWSPSPIHVVSTVWMSTKVAALSSGNRSCVAIQSWKTALNWTEREVATMYFFNTFHKAL